MTCGVPTWRDLHKTTGIIGTPLLEVNTRFISPATCDERLQVHTSIREWRSKVFIQKHIVKRGETLLCEGTATRAFCIRHPEDPDRLKAIPVPEDIKALCAALKCADGTVEELIVP